jgi:ComF family protein
VTPEAAASPLARAARAASAALDLLLPPRCPGCGAVTASPEAFCAACFGAIRWLGPDQCARCGDAETDRHPACGRCREASPAFADARAAAAYEGIAKAVALRFKHGDATALAAALAARMARVAPDWLGLDALLVPVPLHRWRLWRRGYNQAALLARALARRTGATARLDALVRARRTELSAGMGRAERAANVAGAIACARPAAVAGRRVVLVDDVIASGATIAECARALADAGAQQVDALAFARVVRNPRATH